MLKLDSWVVPSSELSLLEGEVHVWRAYLNCGEAMLAKLHSSLAPDERARANRYFLTLDRNRFVATRGILRDLLSKYMGCAPSELRFVYTPHGKPLLSSDSLSRPIHFNVSHSHGLALFAFSFGREIGVDVELVRPDFGGNEIAERYFAPQEVKELLALPVALQAEAFFLCWTRKEAYVKARGQGLYLPLADFSVSLTPGQPERLSSEDMMRWSLRSLRPDVQYVGALVAEGRGWSLHCWDWRLLEGP